MLTVVFSQEEADFLLEEFGIETDANGKYTFTKPKITEIQDMCLEIEVGGLPNDNGPISRRGHIAATVYNTILYAKRAKRNIA